MVNKSGLSLIREKIENVKNSNLSQMDKECVVAVLRKQISKKPLNILFPWCVCPTCGSAVHLLHLKEHIQNGKTTYCDFCSQAFLWESEEQEQ